MYYYAERRIGKRLRLIVRYPNCLYCGKRNPDAARGRPRRTCSDLCRQKYRRARKRDQYREADRIARAAETILKRVERYRGRVDDTPYQPRGILSRRDEVLFDLRNGMPLRFCQWCAMPMPYHGFGGRRVHCCSKQCRDKFGVFRRKLDEALHYYRGDMDRTVTFGLRFFDYNSKEPQPLLRSIVNLCPHCSRPFGITSYTRKYCSQQCRQAAWYRRHHRLVATRRHCLGCNRKFKARYVNQTTCSPACRIRYENVFIKDLPGMTERVCKECGLPFWTNQWRKVFCTVNCRWRFAERDRRNPLTYVPVRERCAWCGKDLPPPSLHGGRHRQTCSNSCNARLNRMRRKQPIPLPPALVPAPINT